MKRFFILSAAAVFIIMIIPLIIVLIMGGVADNSEGDRGLIKVYFAAEDKVLEINRAEYLEGVVAAEMAAEFNKEALRAQAVAARTYMVYHSENAKEHKDGAVVCTDYKHCQAWTNIDDKMESWGDNAEKYRHKIEQAVKATSDEVIAYEDKPINAVFFSTSSGNTENAADVWGEAFPYLVSVSSPGEENAPNFTSESVVSKDEAKKLLSDFNAKLKNADFSGTVFSDIGRSEAGGIKSISVCGVKIKGTELRSIFSLKSTNAQIDESGDSIKFSVKGYGHGVGMSQYGAQAMAENGADYKEILAHYYTGTSVIKQK